MLRLIFFIGKRAKFFVTDGLRKYFLQFKKGGVPGDMGKYQVQYDIEYQH